MPTTYTEGSYPSDWLKGEQLDPTHFSRENVIVLAGSGAERALTSGMVLGKITKGTVTTAADGGNTGDGDFAATPTAGAAAVAGAYELEIVEAAANAGRFIVRDPQGDVIAEGNVAEAFAAGGLAFTLDDGANDFVVGDKFTITVAAGNGKVVQLDLAGTDGTEDAYGLLFDDVTAPDAVDAQGVAVVRNARIDPSKITWPAGASGAQIAAGLALLAAQGILAGKGE